MKPNVILHCLSGEGTARVFCLSPGMFGETDVKSLRCPGWIYHLYLIILIIIFHYNSVLLCLFAHHTVFPLRLISTHFKMLPTAQGCEHSPTLPLPIHGTNLSEPHQTSAVAKSILFLKEFVETNWARLRLLWKIAVHGLTLPNMSNVTICCTEQSNYNKTDALETNSKKGPDFAGCLWKLPPSSTQCLSAVCEHAF